MTDFNDKKLQEIYERAEKEAFSVDEKTAQKFAMDIDFVYVLPRAEDSTRYMRFQMPYIYHTIADKYQLKIGEHGYIKKGTIHKILGEVKRDEFHVLKKEELRDISFYLANPLVVIETETGNKKNIVAILDLQDKKDRFFGAYFHLEKVRRRGDGKTELASVYTRKNLDKWIENNAVRIVYLNETKEISRIHPCLPSLCWSGDGVLGPQDQKQGSSSMDQNILTRSELVNQRLMDYLTFLTLGIETALNSDKAKAFQEKHTKTPTNELLKKIHHLEKLKGRLPKMPKQRSNTLARIKAKTKDGRIQ